MKLNFKNKKGEKVMEMNDNGEVKALREDLKPLEEKQEDNNAEEKEKE